MPEAKLQPARLLLVAVLLPVVIAGATYLAMGPLAAGNRPVVETTLAFGLFVLEVGLVGIVVGNAMPHPLLRWLLFGWIMVLVDLLVGSLAMVSADGYLSRILPCGALAAAQIGLGVIWGILGDARWYWRVPLSIGLAAGVLGFWIFWVTGWNGGLMTQILVIQSTSLTLICIGLRVRGYRLAMVQQATAAAKDGRRRFQFGVRDVLIWTTVLAILLGLMRAADMLRWKSLQEHPSLYLMSTVALLSAIAIVFALWAALGQGSWLLRYCLLLSILLGLGAGLGAWCKYGGQVLQRQASTSFYDWDLWQWYEVGWWWIAWMFLAGGLLTATLLIFRAEGYRLVRERGAGQPGR